MAHFHLALDNISHFEYGKILLALSSPSEIEAMVDKDWLLDTLGGHCVRPILHYTLDTVQREELIRAGYTGALVE